MPGFDGSGPQGVGPTGFKRGNCANSSITRNSFFGQFQGFGRGRCCWGRGMQNSLSLEEEEKILTQRLDLISKAKKNKQQDK